MSGPRVAILALVLATQGLACKEREPYPSAPGGAEQDAAAPEAPAEPMPLAAVVTPEGSFIATARPDGSDLDVRRVPGWLYVRRDGSIARFEVDARSQGKPAGDTPESVFATLSWRAGDDTRVLFPPGDQKRPDLKRLAAADPDLASLYYHREAIRPFGASGASFSWIVRTEGFLGGAHPYSDARVLAVDAESGQPADLRPLFGGRNVEAEALQGVKPDECVRRFAGLAEVEGRGGEPVFVAMLAHEFEVCRGRIRLVRLAPPDLRGPSPRPAPVRIEDGVLQSESGDLRAPGIADHRASPDGRVVVMLLALGPKDRAPSPLVEAAERAKSREVRLWVRGAASPVVLGRATRLLTVQFLMDHPARSAILDAFSRL